jgi:hypothetical protein
MTTNGHIDITGDGIHHFPVLDRLVVDIYFTDSAGNVLDKQTFYSADKLPVNNKAPHMFKRSFKLPKGTSHIAFGYDGTAREDGSKKYEFQHSPFR